jgi:hypothetical protein
VGRTGGRTARRRRRGELGGKTAAVRPARGDRGTGFFGEGVRFYGAARGASANTAEQRRQRIAQGEKMKG